MRLITQWFGDSLLELQIWSLIYLLISVHLWPNSLNITVSSAQKPISSLKLGLIYDWIIVTNRLAPTLPGSAVNHADTMSASEARG